MGWTVAVLTLLLMLLPLLVALVGWVVFAALMRGASDASDLMGHY